MALKLKLVDAMKLGAQHDVELVGSYLSPTQPATWTCAHGHSFEISLNSLKRRIRNSTSPCRTCDALDIQRRRAESEFQAVKEAAQKNGLQLIGDVSGYKNQNSKFYFKCDQCNPCTAAPMRAEKIKIGQVCEVLRRDRQRDQRRLPFSYVQTVVQNHPLNLTLVSDETSYKTNRSKLVVCCANGHNFETTICSLQRRTRNVGCPLCSPRRGQAIATAITGLLLQTKPITEHTPNFLGPDWRSGRNRLRFDAYFKKAKVNGLEVDFALEFQGPQHFDPDHYFHSKSPLGAKVAFERLRDGDAHKVVACSNQQNVSLAVVDARVSETQLTVLVDIVARSLEQARPDLLLDDAYQNRKSQLSVNAQLTKMLQESGIAQSAKKELAKQLSSRSIDLLGIDPISGRASCKCKRCGFPDEEGQAWTPLVNNLLDGKSVNRQGSGCPKCNVVKRGIISRLTEEEVTSRARMAGWKPLWEPGSYAGQYVKMKWACMSEHCTGHPDIDFAHLLRTKRPKCDT